MKNMYDTINIEIKIGDNIFKRVVERPLWVEDSSYETDVLSDVYNYLIVDDAMAVDMIMTSISEILDDIQKNEKPENIIKPLTLDEQAEWKKEVDLIED